MGPKNNDRAQSTKDRLRKKLAMKGGEKKICLTMIVKNESKNMPRVLNSVRPIVDMISIVDTGSTDDTEKVILDWGKENGVPTTVHHEPFKNFAHNRTDSVKKAKATYPDADFFLLSDADFVWELDKRGKFDKVLLIDHKYLIEQYNPFLTYWNIRLLSAKVDWECVGVTHEYWTECKVQSSFTGQVTASKIHTIMIDDKEDGGCKTDKFERDLRLLREGLADADTPDHLKTRYKFYLAQTLKDTGNHQESIVWYQERAKDGGWEEEVYYAKYQVGFNYEIMATKLSAVEGHSKEEVTSLFKKALESYTDAYRFRKSRAESLLACCRVYRNLGNPSQSMDTAIVGSKIPYPANDTLFIEKMTYEWAFDVELSISAFFVPERKDEGRQAVSRLLSRDDLPKDVREQVEHNSRFYI